MTIARDKNEGLLLQKHELVKMQLDVEESTPADITPIDVTLELHLAIVVILLMRFPGSAPDIFSSQNYGLVRITV